MIIFKILREVKALIAIKPEKLERLFAKDFGDNVIPLTSLQLKGMLYSLTRTLVQII